MKSEVIMGICDKKAVITVCKKSDDTFSFDIKSNCEHIQKCAEKLRDKEISLADACQSYAQNPIYINAYCLTPTCIIPAGMVSLIWIEAGMTSKGLALKNKNEIKFSE